MVRLVLLEVQERMERVVQVEHLVPQAQQVQVAHRALQEQLG